MKFPYLIRSAEQCGPTLQLQGDSNATSVEAEVWTDECVESITFNNRPVIVTKTDYGSLKFEWNATLDLDLPELSSLDWVCNFLGNWLAMTG